MKTLHLTLWLLLGSPLFLSAQTDTPYALFRPGVNYWYDNPYHEASSGGQTLSPVWGMEWPQDPLAPPGTGLTLPAYQTLLPSQADGFVYRRASHFVGSADEVDPDETNYFRTLTDDGQYLEIPYGAAVGTQTDQPLAFRVDSIVVEEFLGVTDSVKYLSLWRAEDTVSVLPSLRISREYGLLTGFHFGLPFDYPAAVEVVGISSIDPSSTGARLEQTPELGIGDVFCEVKADDPRLVDGEWFWEYTERKYTVSMFLCDPVFNVIEVELKIDELHYLADRQRQQARDSSYRDSVRQMMTSRLIGFAENVWYAQPVGTLWFSGGENDARMIEPYATECPGEGKTLGTTFGRSNTDVDIYHLVFDTGYGEAWFPNVPFATNYGYGMSGSSTSLVGLSISSQGDCGELFDFTGLVSNRPTPIDDIRIQLAPNPVATALRIDVPEDLGQVYTQIYDAAGRLLVTTPASTGPRSLAVDQLLAGMYQAVLLEANGRRVAARRFLRQ